MVLSQLEMQIRAMDNKDMGLEVSARQIAKNLGANENTCRAYLVAKRKGYSSFSHYLSYVEGKWKCPSQRNHAFEISTTSKELDTRGSMELNPYKIIERTEMLERLASLLGGDILNKGEKYVITKIFFEEKTLREIAKEKGVSHEEIFFTKREALEKLRYALIREGIKDCA